MLLMTRSAYAQQGYASDSLFIVLYSVGDALVEFDIRVENPLADSVSVRLFGDTITGLIVTDFEDRLITFRTGSGPGEILITPAGATDIRISYFTPDLVSKSGREWTFAVDSPVAFSVKMPQDSTPIQYGGTIPDQVQIGSQTLLTFPAGNQTVTYIVGFLGTDDSANLAMRTARTLIEEEKRNNPSIILAGAQELLARAQEAYNAEQYIDAESFARQASELVETTVEDYGEAIQARAEANARITEAEAQSRDVTGARALLEQSNQQFAGGDYAAAANSAEDSVRAIGGVQQNLWPYGVGALVAGGVASALYMIRKRQPMQQSAYVDPDPTTASEPVHWPNPAQPPSPPSVPAPEPAARLAGIPESQVDRDLLAGIVHRIIEERPHLRQEDRDVLVFLAQSEGAAFESEVRTRFELPKTTVWRLVKRLEREELVEIRKAGGQNLIKLRFEGRQP
jgi:uncharacterized membrane protein